MKCLVPMVLAGCVLLPAGTAQTVMARFTAGVTSYADEGAINEPAVGGGVRFYFSRRWSVEPEFIHTRSKNGLTNSRNYNLWGSVSFDFRDPERSIVPYWHGGPGLIRHTNRFAQFSSSTTEAGFGTGAGVRFLLSDRVFVAPQLRLGVADAVFVEVTGSIGFILKK